MKILSEIFPPLISHQSTIKSLINEHTRLAFLEFFATILSIFYVINKKFHHTRLLIYLVNKRAGWHFFPPYSLFWSDRLLGTSEFCQLRIILDHGVLSKSGEIRYFSVQCALCTNCNMHLQAAAG